MGQVTELEQLNEYQRAAVLDEHNACIVNANVGSGKTTVLIAKLLYLHEQKNVAYRNMMVLTFTNKAAFEIKERLQQADKEVTEEDLRFFGTFHSVALKLLRDRIEIIPNGYGSDFLVIEPDEELDMALALIQEEKYVIKYKNRLKKRLEQAIAVREESRKVSKYKDDLFLLVERLRLEKQKQNKMSFADLISYTVQIPVEQLPELQWIVIDEVQDSDVLQMELIDHLKKEETSLFAVGDPNQIIYSWRGSTFHVFFQLKQKYDAVELSLPINYRSSSTILEAAGRFLQNGGKLSASRESGEKIVVRKHYNPFQEADYLADQIRVLHEKGIPYREIAVFYRLQDQSKTFEEAFARAEIPYEVSLKKTIRDILVLNWLLYVLRFCVNEQDKVAGTIALSDHEYGENRTPKQAQKLLGEREEQNSGLLLRMREFKEQSQNITDAAVWYQQLELDQNLKPTSAAYAEDKQLVLDLLERIITYSREQQLNLYTGLQEFLGSAALYGINILKKEIHNAEDSVKLMTLHASKGLEFSHVFITGVNYGLIPLPGKSMEDEEEERRLFFVGITRAKDYLELSYYINPDHYRVAEGPSSYLRMLPAHLLKQEDEEQVQPVDLRDLKRQIKEAMSVNEVQRNFLEQTLIKTPKVTKARKLRHLQYGIGTVVGEDEDMIELEFEGYGKKEFLKAFSELEEL